MYTESTFRAIDVALRWASYTAGTRFVWNRTWTRAELRPSSLGTLFDKWYSFACVVAHATIGFVSLYLHVATHGFRLCTLEDFWVALIAACSFIGPSIFPVHTDAATLCSLLNGSIVLSEGVYGHRKIGDRILQTRQRSDTIFKVLVSAITVMIIQTPTMYITDCRFHMLGTLMPYEVCELKTVLWPSTESPTATPTFATIIAIVRYLCLLIIQGSIFINILGGGLAVFVFLYPTLFSTLGILNHLRAPAENVPYRKALRTHNAVQIWTSAFYESQFGRFVFPGHLLQFSLLFSFDVRAMVKGSVPVAVLVCVVATAFVVVLHYVLLIAVFWRISEASEAWLSHMKKNVLPRQSERRELRACPPIKFEMGFAGHFDKKLYLLIAFAIVDISINSLLL